MKSASVMTWSVILAAAFLCAACGRQEQKPAATAEKKLNVVTTVAPITSIVENIAGDKIQLAGIIPEGINSHTFEPIPSDSKLLSSADLIILNGLDLETPTLKLAQANLKPGAAIYSLGDKTIKEADYIFDFSFPKEQGHPNPHLWLNPEYAMRYATLVRDELIRARSQEQSRLRAKCCAVSQKTRSSRSSDQGSDPNDPAKQSPIAHLS